MFNGECACFVQGETGITGKVGAMGERVGNFARLHTFHPLAIRDMKTKQKNKDVVHLKQPQVRLA